MYCRRDTPFAWHITSTPGVPHGRWPRGILHVSLGCLIRPFLWNCSTARHTDPPPIARAAPSNLLLRLHLHLHLDLHISRLLRHYSTHPEQPATLRVPHRLTGHSIPVSDDVL